jgi:hypothetical protein
LLNNPQVFSESKVPRFLMGGMLKITGKALEGNAETVYHAAQEQDSKRLT